MKYRQRPDGLFHLFYYTFFHPVWQPAFQLSPLSDFLGIPTAPVKDALHHLVAWSLTGVTVMPFLHLRGLSRFKGL